MTSPRLLAPFAQLLKRIARRPFHYMTIFILAMFVVFPFISTSVVFAYAFDMVFYIILLLGTRVWREGLARRFVTAFCMLYIVVDSGNIFFPQLEMMLATSILGMCNLAMITYFVFMHLYNRTEVDTEAIMAGVCLFIFLGFIFNQAYILLQYMEPGSFDFSVHGQPKNMITTYYLLFYYSFVTQLTIGYGDITPLHPLALSLSVLQGIIGQFYVVVFISRLVSLKIVSDQRNQARPPDSNE